LPSRCPSEQRGILHPVKHAADPNTLDWVIAFLQAAAVGGAILAAGFAARAAKAAERNVEAQVRPLLLDVPREPYTDYEHEVPVPPGVGPMTVAWRGEIVANADESWLVMPIRNVGRGVARITSVAAYFHHRPDYGVYAYREVLPPGEETWLGIRVNESDKQARDALWAAIHKGLPPFHVTAHYTDLSGGQRERVTFSLGREGTGRLGVDSVEHYADD
jgi:hypothetical protein